MDPVSETERLAEHLRRVIARAGFDLVELSRDRLQRTPDFLSKMLRGERTFREELGAEVAPGVFEGKIRRFVEEIARRAAREVAEGGGARRRMRRRETASTEVELRREETSDGGD